MESLTKKKNFWLRNYFLSFNLGFKTSYLKSIFLSEIHWKTWYIYLTSRNEPAGMNNFSVYFSFFFINISWMLELHRQNILLSMLWYWSLTQIFLVTTFSLLFLVFNLICSYWAISKISPHTPRVVAYAF
jgi:hypothetical protein